MDIEEMIHNLYSQNHNLAYQTLKQLEIESLKSSVVYAYFDELIDMLKHQSSYVRTRGLTLIVMNAKWDDKHFIEQNINQILLHICDEKPATSRQFIKLLPQLTKYQPSLIPKVLKALLSADDSFYPDSMQSLIKKDKKQAISSIQKSIGYCGLICDECPIFLATISKDQKQKQDIAKAYSTKQCPLDVNDIVCYGCHDIKSNQKMCQDCPIRNCENNEHLHHCGECQKYPCELISTYTGQESQEL